MANAGAEVARLLQQAELRGIAGAMVATTIAMVLAACNATLAGKVMMAVEASIMRYPVVKIVVSEIGKAHGPAD